MIIFCDGGCSGNQNSENFGGWGAVLVCQESFSGKEVVRKEIYGGETNTTNNQMELTATIKALRCLIDKKMPIEVYVDSNYVLQGITEWIHGWKARGWRKADKKPVENKELWIQLDEERNKFSDIMFVKVKGHSGVELNELADQLANKGINEAKSYVYESKGAI